MTFCELSHNGAADSFLDDKCTEWAESRYTAMLYAIYCIPTFGPLCMCFNCAIKYVYIANWSPLGESWKILRVHSCYSFVSWGEIVFVTATSLLIASLLLSTYHTALRECLYFLCQVIQAIDRKTVILVLTSENCAEHRSLEQYLQCLLGSGSVAS